MSDLTAVHVASYSALLANATDDPTVGITLHLSNTATLTLDNVHAANLSASLFHL